MTNVFLSYNTKDVEIARRIASDLTREGLNVWFDEWEIVIGHSISQRIEQGLDNAHFVIVLLTKHSVESGWVEKEWRSKIGQEADNKRVVILPVIGERCKIPTLLRDKRYADIRDSYDKGIEELINSIKIHSKTIDGRKVLRIPHDFIAKIKLIVIVGGGATGYAPFELNLNLAPMHFIEGLMDMVLNIKSHKYRRSLYWVEGEKMLNPITPFFQTGIQENDTLILVEVLDIDIIKFMYKHFLDFWEENNGIPF